jgi:hypothetical protein
MKTSNSVFRRVYGAPFAARRTSLAVVSASDKFVSGAKEQRQDEGALATHSKLAESESSASESMAKRS